MLNPFSISLAAQPLKIYSGLCLNEGSSLTHRAPLILGEKTNSRPADTRLTVPFPSPRDTQPLPRHHSPPPLQLHQHLGAPWLWECFGGACLPSGYPLLPMALPGDAPVGGRCPTATLPCQHRDGAGNRSEECCKFLSAGAAHSQALITAWLQGPAWLGWIPGSSRAPRASRAPETALMDCDRT